MNDQMKPIVRATLLFLSALLLFWAFVPMYRTYAAGFILGMSISLVNAWILSIKIKAISRNIIEKTEKRVGLGTVSRMCMALIGVMIALKVPQFDLIFTIIGLFFVQLATLLMGLLFSKRNHS
ncbi:ATP synthase subunit I [Paenibacillus sp. NPDC056579]|uniref:ATP synthase subunit I n=1 Tax=unclassified Paenibacillus TaxID=185978 RepID=UPI001EF91361|nr:ATP synthase subunit I [Paenibacillus sp. H1-7]ULL19505.1 ATP synthase subunit I [Paenibacillus sp. H1-7]